MAAARTRLIASTAATVAALSIPPGGTRVSAQGAPVLMNYSDASEVSLALAWLSVSRHAQLHTIGHSLDYKTDPNRPAIYPIQALRISASTDENITDDNRRNSVLFECGSHAREWLATESCLALATHLVNNAENEQTYVPELLSHVDVWIIPLTTVAGRVIDDRHGGNPLRFDRSESNSGWRGNGDVRGSCSAGVNVARNFSAGWNSTQSTDCTDDGDGSNDDPAGGGNDDPVGNYRGFAPFSTTEATALKNFVLNHGISMAVVVHSNAQQIWNRWGDADVAGRSLRQDANFMWSLNATDANILLEESIFGGGFGQFSAWLAESSDTVAQPDTGTRRSIQTIFVELPFLDANLNSGARVDAYNLGSYRFDAYVDDDEGSNGFHPSNNQPVRDVIRQNFIPMAEQLIQAARSPGCPDFGECPRYDFGLVGAKLGPSSLGAGALHSYPAGCTRTLANGICTQGLVPARDYLGVGTHNVYFRVQRFGREPGNDDVQVEVSVDVTVNVPEGSYSLPRTTVVRRFDDMALKELRTGSVALSVLAEHRGADYTVTIRTIPRNGSVDTFTSNDRKVFKFRSR
jgi:hypothetical protein